jgi:hypothetical protein
MSNFSHSRALEFITANRNPDGGWGYRPGGKSLVEPTAFCLLSLNAGNDRTATAAGLDFLKTCQQDSGAVGIGPAETEGSWMAYAALLAFHALGAAAEGRRLTDWILGFKDASERFSPEEISSIAALFHYDASIRGWSWTPGMTAWVEPTALFIIALVRAGTPPTQDRVRSGVSLIINRKVRTGGWNFGNPYSKSYDLKASLMSTAIALAALGAAGYPEERAPVGEGFVFLDRALAGDVSTASLAWSLLALRAFPSMAVQVPEVAARLAGLQVDMGGFRDNLFETALATLVLEHPNALLPGQARRL